ncbi:GAL102 [Candida oxycetoniae]|uniref:GAL102 n=1 Tax=Candida oxycetoniae TaxID=497107 RepID=A0AAI9SXQ3_9ASCO|nr:GAL102 [Candida oxycetoniae]KAI3404927.2 GAL102 [Candida oxycetoniae]
MYYEKRVLVAGGAGFIGSNFLVQFVKRYPNYSFICVDYFNYASNRNIIRDLSSIGNFEFLQLDLSGPLEKIVGLVKSYAITDIINFAAESSVDRSFQDPLFFTKNNIIATQNLLECQRLFPSQIKWFLHVSTDEVYGDELENCSEVASLSPTNPYAASKAAIDLIINAYRKSYNSRVTIVRSSNVFGPNQDCKKLIPLIIKCGMDGTNVPIHGDGTNKRSYLYISDFLDAIDLIWRKRRDDDTVDGIYNISGDLNQMIENRVTVEIINEVFGFTTGIDYVEDRNYNDQFYSIDSTKVHSLGWEQRISLRDGLVMMMPMMMKKIGPKN